MSVVTIPTGGFEVDATVIAAAFGLEQSTLQQLMRDGQVTSLCEAGVDEDAGRYRLTFHHDGRALRLTVDVDGRVLSKAIFPSGRGGSPADRR